MDNLKIYQICHDLIDYFVTLTSPKKSHLYPIFRIGGSISQPKHDFKSLFELNFSQLNNMTSKVEK